MQPHNSIRTGQSQQSDETHSSGLVNGHISARAYSGTSAPSRSGKDIVLGVHPGGLGAKVRTVGSDAPPQREHTGGGKRGRITAFSKDSQRRFRDYNVSVDWQGGARYIGTLTYHEHWGPPEAWTRARRAFEERLERAYNGRAETEWKLEPQQRGAPHFHVIIFWDGKGPDIHKFRQWVSKAWNEIVAPGDAEHLAAGTQVLELRNTSGPDMPKFLKYLGKTVHYMGKGEGQRRFVDDSTGEVIEHTGRIWGHSRDVPRREPDMYSMNQEAYYELLRRLRRWGRASRYLSSLTINWASFMVLGDGHILEQLLRGLEAVPT